MNIVAEIIGGITLLLIFAAGVVHVVYRYFIEVEQIIKDIGIL